MSATVSYKGSNIATVANETKTLNTSGKWMEDDVSIVDQSIEMLVIDTEDSGGGTIRNIYTTDGVSLQTTKTVSLTSSPQIINPDTGYDGFADGATITINGSFATMAGMEVYVGDYVNDVITLTSGRIDKGFRHVYGR